MDTRVLTFLFNCARRIKPVGAVSDFLCKYSSAAFFLIYYAGAVHLIFTDIRALIFYLVVPFCTLAASWIIKNAVKRKRPFNGEKGGYSFPSNHSASAGIIAFACLFINTGFGVPVSVFALLTGTSRVTAGIHYPSDILAGFALSTLFAVPGFYILPFVI